MKRSRARNFKSDRRPAPAIASGAVAESADVEEDAAEQDDLENEGGALDSEILEGELVGEDGSFAQDQDADPVLPAVVESETSVPAVPPYLDPLKRYMRDISRYPLLSPEEEFSLAVKLRDTGDIDAAKRLVQANLRLVVKIAMEYRSAYQNVLDLIQEGNVGLMKAVSKFDVTKGAKLSYYASWWIRSYMLKYILENFRLVRVGTTAAQKKLFFHLMREKERLEAQGIVPGPKLLADKFNVREQDVVEMEKRLGAGSGDVSLNTPLGGESDSTATHQDMLVDEAEAADAAVESDELRKILREHLADFVKTLKEKELAVFKERLAADSPKTLQEVADQFGLTRERARQIETMVIEKLRAYYKNYIR